MDRSGILKKLLNSGETLIMPDAYDPISAKLIEKEQFKAIQCSGYSFSIAAGYPSENNITLSENIELTRKIVESVDIPVMADGEDGYGGPEKVKDTIKKFMQTGVAGINLEDQILDGKRKISVVDENLMSQKIMFSRETVELEGNPNFIINARTDALRSTEDRSEGLEIAIDRANQYIESGADLVFVTYVETMDEVKIISREVNGPISIAAGMHYNIENFSIKDLKKQGIARISLPTLLILSSFSALKKSLKSINEDNMWNTNSSEFQNSIQDLNSLLKNNVK
jgi:2-methylisocitrate lyase-like PEP mutase family enzyme